MANQKANKSKKEVQPSYSLNEENIRAMVEMAYAMKHNNVPLPDAQNRAVGLARISARNTMAALSFEYKKLMKQKQ